ncbi:MAG TPA: hypothetical protein PLD84_01985 [Chitinophagales bacterium]|nr:hypothetical protein [Chitinophagales bacterium]
MIFLLCHFLLQPMSVMAQTTNKRIFIQPNTLVVLDTALFKVEDIFSNTFYHTEAYSFEYKSVKGKKASLYIASKISSTYPSQNRQDSLVDLSIEKITQSDNEDFTIYKEIQKIHHKEFLGFGYIAKMNSEKNYKVSLACAHYFKGGLCYIDLTSESKSKIENYDDVYSILTLVIDGIQIYTEDDFAKEDSVLKSSIKITVDSIATPYNVLVGKPAAFYGRVRIEGCQRNQIKEISIEKYHGIFFPGPDGTVLISCNESGNERIEKNDELTIFNSIGREVRIPFSFTYFKSDP